MHIEPAIRKVFNQLQVVVNTLDDSSYSKKLQVLNTASIGQHYRHLIEIFVCLNEGYETGTVNYETRRRDITIEQSIPVATGCVEQLLFNINKLDKPLILHAGYNNEGNDVAALNTSYYRELAYALEHAVHHMALIRIGLTEAAPDALLPVDFGVAASTIKYRNECAQ